MSCDGCGGGLLLDADVRYILKIEVYAAYDPLEVTRGEVARDRQEEMASLIERMRSMDPRDLEDQVYRRFLFDLCPRCQRVYLRDPLHPALPSEAPPGGTRNAESDGGEER